MLKRFRLAKAGMWLQHCQPVRDEGSCRIMGPKGVRWSAPRRKIVSCRPRAQEGKIEEKSKKMSMNRFVLLVVVLEIVS